MSDDNSSAPPTTEVTSPSPASATDSAPPPQAAAPEAPATPVEIAPPPFLPPRTAFVDTPSPTVFIPQFRPNSTIPSFLRLLASLVFLGGSAGAALAFIYRTFLHPRLVLAIEAKRRLYENQVGVVDRLRGGVRDLAGARGYGVMAPGVLDEKEAKAEVEEELGGEIGIGSEVGAATQVNKGEGKQEEKNQEEKDVKKEVLDGSGSTSGLESTSAIPTTEPPTPESTPIPTPAPRIFTPLLDSLSILTSSLATAATPSPALSHSLSSPSPSTLFSTPPSKASLSSTSSNSHQPNSHQLTTTLTTLNDYLTASTLSGISNSYRINGVPSQFSSYGSSGGNKASTDVFFDAVGELKSEIRAVKGALLNRRNFAALAPRVLRTSVDGEA